MSITPHPTIFLEKERRPYRANLQNCASKERATELELTREEKLAVNILQPLFTSCKVSLNSKALTKSFLPIFGINESIIIQAQSLTSSVRSIRSLNIHSFLDLKSFAIPLENIGLLHSMKISKLANKILIHGDHKYLRLMDLDNKKFLLLGADLHENSDVLISDHGFVIAASLGDNTIKVWKMTDCETAYIGFNFFQPYDELNNLSFNYDQSCLLFTYKKEGKYFLGVLDFYSIDPLRKVKSILIGTKKISFIQPSLKAPEVLVGCEDESGCFVDLITAQVCRNQSCLQDCFISPTLRFSVNSNEITDLLNHRSYPLEIPAHVKDLRFKSIEFSSVTDDVSMVLGDFFVQFHLGDGKCFNIYDLTVKADSFKMSRSESFLAGIGDDGKVSAWRLH